MLNPADYAFLSDALKQRSGLALTTEKGYLIETRLRPIALEYGMRDVDDLVAALRLDPREEMMSVIVDAMTTNESFFFRDNKPFNAFREVMLPHLMRTRAERRSFRIWCAACSSGQEPYSIAMILDDERIKLANWRIEIVATDISPSMLARAHAGRFNQFEVQRGLPTNYLVKHFKKVDGAFEIDPALRNLIEFREFNLMSDPRPLGVFDVVFCRNVLIYFDPPTKSQVLQQIRTVMPDDGFLLLGAAETVIGVTDEFAPHENMTGVYSVANSAPRIAAFG